MKIKEHLLNRWLLPFRETENPIYAWRTYFNARRLGLPIPEDVLKYLDGVAHEITNIADNPEFFTNPDHSDDSPIQGIFRVYNVLVNSPSPGLRTITVIVGWQDTIFWHYHCLTTIL